MSGDGHPSAERLPLGIGAAATLATVWEASAPKPGNVHRGADFLDMGYVDFLTSAAVTGPIVEQAAELGLGPTLLAAVDATQASVGVNTNLGTLLLVVPLAWGASERTQGVTLYDAAAEAIRQATPADTASIYAAIRRAAPGGMGRVERGDIHQEPTLSLVEAMELAAERDLVARQYVNGFAEVAATALSIEREVASGAAMPEAIVTAQLQLLAEQGDSLVLRKLGQEASQQVAARAGAVLAARNQSPDEYRASLADFDFWLRSDGHRRNPGTTADLIAAALFALLVEDRLSWPVKF